jgi:hypothetical protein
MANGAMRSSNGGLINSGRIKTDWMNGHRFRAHGIILGLCLWSVYGWMVAVPGTRDRNGNLKGADFSHLYTLGSVALTHRAADLYDANAQAAITARRIPGAAGIAYVPIYPPQVSIFFAPLATLPYRAALVIWLVTTAIVYGFCCYASWRACPRLRSEGLTVLILAIAFPGFFHLIVWGQTSAMALACFTAAFFFLRAEKPFLAGLALGCLIFKPQLGVAAAFIFALTGAWRVIAGGLLSAAAQVALPAIYYGGESLRAWIRAIRSVGYNLAVLEPRPYQAHNLRIFWSLLISGRTLPFSLYVISALLILGLTATVWTRRPSLPLSARYSALVLASVLVAPHLIVYDLVILAPAFLLMGDWMVEQSKIGQSPGSDSFSSMKILLYLTYLAPLLSGPIARLMHLQISVAVMSALVYLIWRLVDGHASLVVGR